MKISELSTEKVADVLCEIAPHATAILTDEEITNELKKAVEMKDISTPAGRIAVACEKITALVPLFLKKRRENLFAILAAVNETTVETIASQNIMLTMEQVKEMVQDRELMLFFKSCTNTGESE